MGAWGTGPFDNDDALDWIPELAASRDASILRHALEDVALATGGAYIEAPDAAIAVAAAAVVALADEHSNLVPPPVEVADWLIDHPGVLGGDLKGLALVALRRIASDSELAEVWAGSHDAQAWQLTIERLEQALEIGPS